MQRVTIGKNLERIRRSKRLSKLELSKSSGVSRSYISEMESNKYSNLSLEVICKLCKALEITPNDLIPEELYR